MKYQSKSDFKNALNQKLFDDPGKHVWIEFDKSEKILVLLGVNHKLKKFARWEKLGSFQKILREYLWEANIEEFKIWALHSAFFPSN